MICIKVSLFLIELLSVAKVKHWLSKTFCETGFPICSRILVSQIDQYKRRISDLNSKQIVYYSRLGYISKIDSVEAN